MKKIFSLLLIVFIFTSCKTITKTVEVPVETIKKEYITNVKHDSIFVKDSVDRWLKGDTLYIYKEHTKYKYLNKIDTIIKTDSIPKLITINTTKEVKVNHIYWYQKILIYIGSISLLLLIGFIIYKIKFK